jgi:ParB family chromosome partitioning protein
MTLTPDTKRKALGRGLEVLLPAMRPSSSPAIQDAGALEIAVDLIDRNPYQTRSHIDEASLNELAASIVATGVIQPILVRPGSSGRYQLIAGERRWLASQRAGKATIPALVRQVSNEQAMEITIIENLQREDLNPMEQARAFERLANEFGLTQEQIAARTGKDRASIGNFMRLLRLPLTVQTMVERGEISFGHARALLALESSVTIEKAAEMVRVRGLSVRQTEAMVQEFLHPSNSKEKANKTRSVDPNVREAEQQLQRTLGMKVTIHDRSGKGKIVIEYASLEDFDRVVASLS